MSPDPSRFLPLHPLTFRVLMALLKGPSFGTEIVRHIEAAEPRARLYPANLFRRIRDLLSDKLLEECAGPSDADPRRSYVQITELGRAVAHAEARRLSDLTLAARDANLLSDA